MRLLCLAVALTILAPALFAHAGERSFGDIVRQLLAAYNDHDVDAMLEVFAGDVRWLSVAGPVISIESEGQADIAAAMHSYFKSRPTTQSEIRDLSTAGPFVTALEEAYRIVDGKKRGQCAISVYEIREQKIQNVWYFDAFSCPARSESAQPTDN